MSTIYTFTLFVCIYDVTKLFLPQLWIFQNLQAVSYSRGKTAYCYLLKRGPSFGQAAKELLTFLINIGCHPFQRGPSFGQAWGVLQVVDTEKKLPSLSERTFFRTNARPGFPRRQPFFVAIPFREDLLSDIPFVLIRNVAKEIVAIPFREDLLSDLDLQEMQLVNWE